MKEYELAGEFEKLLRKKIGELIYDNQDAYTNGIIKEYYAGEREGLEASLFVMLDALASMKRRGS